MKALFVHDHRFPSQNGIYYQSYGFDDEFLKRYLNIFDKLGIYARHVTASKNDKRFNEKYVNKVMFYTEENSLPLKGKDDYSLVYITKEYDCMIIRLPSILGLRAMNFARKKNVPYIIELVGCAWDAYWYHNLYGKIIAPVMFLATKEAISKAEHVIYVSKTFLQERYPTKGKSIDCSNVFLYEVDEDVLKKRLDKIKNRDTNKKIILGSCGSIDMKYKGYQYVIATLPILKEHGYDIEYQIVGGGSSNYLESVAKKYGVRDNVKFLGIFPHNRVYEWLNTIDIYIQPSLTEGLPRTVIEAISRGCPTIGSSAGGIIELLGQDCLYSKRNKNALAGTFQFVYSNQAELAAKNYERAKLYTLEILEEKRMNFYEVFIKSIIEERKG